MIDMRSDLAWRRERAEDDNRAFMAALESYARRHDPRMLAAILGDPGNDAEGVRG